MSTAKVQHPEKQQLSGDATALAAIGRRDQLERNWGFWQILGFAVTNLCSWEFATPLIGSAFINGGPVAIVYGFASTCFGIMAINMSLAEMASIYPVAAGQYFWTYHFAPPSIRVFLSYLQGWFTSIAWQVGFVSTTLFIADQLESLVILSHPSYAPQKWHTFLIMLAFTVISALFHLFGRRIMPTIQAVSGICHVVFFFVIIIVLLAMSDKAPSSFVWTTFENDGGWSNNGISFCIGLLLPAFSISGADGCVHMAEEVRNAAWNIPRAFVWTLVINGIMAFVIMVVALYCITDLDAVLDSDTGYPIIAIFQQATGSNAAASVMDMMMILIMITCSFCLMAAASRLCWSFSRENGFPGSKALMKVDPVLKIPRNALIATVTFATLLSTITIGSTLAIDAIVSLCTVAAFASYTLPIGSFLWYRLTHKDIAYGPWRLGRWGVAINIFALCWAIFFVIILPFPSELPVTAANMNYSGPIFLGVIAVLSVDWMLRARHHYHGPVIETHGLEEQEIEETTQSYVMAAKEKDTRQGNTASVSGN